MKKKLFILMLLFVFIIPNMVHAITVDEVKAKGDYKSKNSVYGRNNLSKKELNDISLAVTDFYNTYISEDMDEMKRFEVASRYITETTTYASSWKENKANTAWGSLVYGKAQCSGYARGFKALCDAIDIPCLYVHAKGGSNPHHQWTMVKLKGVWHHYDPQLQGQFYEEGYTPLLMSDDEVASLGLKWDRSAYPKTGEPNNSNPSKKPSNKPSPVNAKNNISIVIKGKKVKSDIMPVIKNSRTFVPIRVISENLGYKVEWYEDVAGISISKIDANKTKKAILLFVGRDVYCELNPVLVDKYFPLGHTSHYSDGDVEKIGKLMVDGSTIVKMEVAPEIINNHTMVPLRAVANIFGNKVIWDAQKREVLIN